MDDRAPPRLAASRARLLRESLDGLCEAVNVRARLASDPLHFARRYPDPLDAEIAAVFAASLAYGRVAAFWPVVTAVLAIADDRGGPRRFVEGLSRADAGRLAPLQYRWNRGADLALLARTLGVAVKRWDRLGAEFERLTSLEGGDLARVLDGVVGALRDIAVDEAPGLGVSGARFSELPRGFRTLLSRPADGSACKRWNMLLRWMARPPGPVGMDGLPARADGVDLGIWRLPVDRLVIPLDTHVSRLSWFIGLTGRKDGSWRTAEEVTASLRRLDAADPVRFDFALAHLGISGACQARRVPEICGACSLVGVCRVGAPDRRRSSG